MSSIAPQMTIGRAATAVSRRRAVRAESSVRSESSGRPSGGKLRLTRRGRVVLTALASLPILLGVGLVVLNGGGAAAGDSHANVRLQTVTIYQGETLWQVAEEKAPNADPREFIDDVVQLNQLDSANVQPGQKIAIPAQYSHAR